MILVLMYMGSVSSVFLASWLDSLLIASMRSFKCVMSFEILLDALRIVAYIALVSV